MRKVGYLLLGFLFLAGVLGTLWFQADAGSRPAEEVPDRARLASNPGWIESHQEMIQQCHPEANEKFLQEMAQGCPAFQGPESSPGNKRQQEMGKMPLRRFYLTQQEVGLWSGN